jgi:hypothetical protein
MAENSSEGALKNAPQGELDQLAVGEEVVEKGFDGLEGIGAAHIEEDKAYRYRFRHDG